MNTVIRLDEKTAEIHIIPTSPLNREQIKLVKQYGDQTVRVKYGASDDLVFVLEVANGKTSAPVHAEDVPERAHYDANEHNPLG